MEPKLEMTSPIPVELVTPNHVETRLGTLQFADGLPDKATVDTFLILAPGYEGAVPEGYFGARSPTINNLLFWRVFVVGGDLQPAADSIQKHFRRHPLGTQASAPTETYFDKSWPLPSIEVLQ